MVLVACGLVFAGFYLGRWFEYHHKTRQIIETLNRLSEQSTDKFLQEMEAWKDQNSEFLSGEQRLKSN